MKRIVSLLLCAVMIFTGCTSTVTENQNTTDVSETQTIASLITEAETEQVNEINEWNDISQQYDSLDDENLLAYVEDMVYTETVNALNSEEYFVENVTAVYISQEYLDEVAFNSQSNIYFGYTLAELDELFQDTKYVFTLSDTGETTVQELVEIKDTTNEEILKNVAIGTGVILVCVTVSLVTGGAGAPAVSMIFATAAKTGAIMAVSSGALGGVSAGVVRGVETGDMGEALEAAILVGSEDFKWGALGGSISGGAGQAIALKGATLNNLTMNEAALIQKESKLPLDFIKNFHSMDEYKIFKNTGVQLTKVKGKWSYVQDIDWDFIGDLDDGRTNAQRVIDGLAPLDQMGKSYELHHIGQKADSPLAVLTSSQHKGNYSILHLNTGGSASQIDRNVFNKEKREYWKALLEMAQEG